MFISHVWPDQIWKFIFQSESLKKKKNVQKFINQTGYVHRINDICSETDVIADNSMNKEMFLSILIDIDRPAKAFCMTFVHWRNSITYVIEWKAARKTNLDGVRNGVSIKTRSNVNSLISLSTPLTQKQSIEWEQSLFP